MTEQKTIELTQAEKDAIPKTVSTHADLSELSPLQVQYAIYDQNLIIIQQQNNILKELGTVKDRMISNTVRIEDLEERCREIRKRIFELEARIR